MATEIAEENLLATGIVKAGDGVVLAAGIPLVQAFEIVGNGHDNAAMQKLIMSIKGDVEGGSSLAEAIQKHPLYFDDLFVNLVEAGEQAGEQRQRRRADAQHRRPRIIRELRRFQKELAQLN